MAEKSILGLNVVSSDGRKGWVMAEDTDMGKGLVQFGNTEKGKPIKHSKPTSKKDMTGVALSKLVASGEPEWVNLSDLTPTRGRRHKIVAELVAA